MPRNTNGVYSLPPGNPVVSGTLIESTWANPTMSDLGNEITQSLPRNGSAGMTGPLMLARDGILPKEATTVDQLNAAVSGSNSYMPAGAVALFAFNTIPTGWLECNGAAVSRTTYANLFTTIGTLYGPGNGTTTFNLPDLRGQFIRGFDNGRNVDPLRVFGSSQTPSNQAHVHTITDPQHSHVNPAHTHGINDPGHFHAAPQGISQSGGSSAPGEGTFGLSTQTGSAPTGVTIAATSISINNAATGITIASEGGESHPANVAMIYCIKAFGALQTDGLGSMAFQNKDAVQITGGVGAFTTLSCTSTPVNPTDVVRLSDLNSSDVVAVLSGDVEMLVVDNSAPTTPVLRPQSNVPNGMVKLNGAGQVPPELLSFTDINYQGPWDASTGQNPSEAFPAVTFTDGGMYQVEIAGTMTLYTSSGLPTPVMCDIGTQIIYTVGSPTLPTTGWYYNPVSVPTTLPATSITFTPAHGIVATNAQDAIYEVADTIPVSTDALPEGTTNLYFLASRVRDTVLTGLSTVAAAVISATDTVLEALEKLQAQVLTKQETLVSGTNIKTVGGVTVLGTGNIPATVMVLGNAQTTTSGSTKDFTGIPSWAKRITVLFNATSHDGSGFTYVQLGTGGTPTVSGYICCASQLGASAIASTNNTTSFIFYDNSAASALCGSLQLNLVSGNTWVANGLCAAGSASASYTTAGNVTLSGVLDMIRIGVNSGNAFDGGSVNIMYEG